VFSVTCCSLNDIISTNTFELYTKIRAFFCQLCPKIVQCYSSLFEITKKPKQRRLRLMNGGGFNNNIRQQQPINEFNVDYNNSRKTIPMPTMHEFVLLCRFSSTSHRSCAFWDSTSMSELQEHVQRQEQLGNIFVDLDRYVSASNAATLWPMFALTFSPITSTISHSQAQ
jgi:hypothetical protein